MKKERIFSEELRAHLMKDIIPFWEGRDIDARYGGYLTCFDREGNLTDDTKYIWFQGRQVYFYAKLYNEIEPRKEWLEKARYGVDFLIKHAYEGNGRWDYQLSRSGETQIGTTSIYADYHVLQGLAEYEKAVGCVDGDVMRILNETYDAVEKNTTAEDFKEIYENTWSPVFIWNDMYLTALNAACIASGALGNERTKALEDECADKMLHWFLRDEYQLMFEAVTRNNEILPEGEGRFINPGHSLESSWFLMEKAQKEHDKKMLERALKIVDWTWEAGHDRKYGGIYSFLDMEGKEPVPLDWHKATNSLWDDKVWWVNAESLCAFANAYALTGKGRYRAMLEDQWDFCRNHFYDPQYGEWYERLHPDGSVKVADKGTSWKCAFHLGRSLITAIRALEAAGK